jgi:hypothetical protein
LMDDGCGVVLFFVLLLHDPFNQTISDKAAKGWGGAGGCTKPW